MGVITFRAWQFMVILYLETNNKWDTTGVYPEFCPVRHFYQQPGEDHGIYLCQVFKLLQFRKNSSK